MRLFSCIGGAAAYLADRINKVITSWKLEEFGSTEAMWFFEVKDFPAIVTMDSLGNSMHKEIEKTSFRRFSELILSKGREPDRRVDVSYEAYLSAQEGHSGYMRDLKSLMRSTS